MTEQINSVSINDGVGVKVETVEKPLYQHQAEIVNMHLTNARASIENALEIDREMVYPAEINHDIQVIYQLELNRLLLHLYRMSHPAIVYKQATKDLQEKYGVPQEILDRVNGVSAS